MKRGAWEIAEAKLCAACTGQMESEYIFQPYGWRWGSGVCERCGMKRLVALRRYTMNRKGLERRGLLNGAEKR